MVDAWMKLEGNVMVKTGEPTWKSLAAALRSIEQTSVADKIKRDIGIPTCTCSLVQYGGKFVRN